MSPQPAPSRKVHKKWVYPLRSRFIDCLIQHRALATLENGDPLRSIFSCSHRHKPSLIPIVGSLDLSLAVTIGLNQAMSFTKEDPNLYSPRGIRWDRGCSAPMFLSLSKL